VAIDWNIILFAILPYVAFVLRQIVEIQRYRGKPYSYSSLSSQFLENRQHFWGSVPFHYGILLVLFAHFGAFLVPRSVLLWNRDPLRLYLLELTGFALGLMALVGIVNIIVRRFFSPKLMRVTSVMDRVIFGLLFLQILTGLSTAAFHRWGSSWFATSASPYLWSLLALRPDVTLVAPLPWMVKLHIVNAWLIIALIPYSRLVHFLVAPLHYLWRKPQVVRWNRPRVAPADTPSRAEKTA
jgi:nitrate reductase gamma subunit